MKKLLFALAMIALLHTCVRHSEALPPPTSAP